MSARRKAFKRAPHALWVTAALILFAGLVGAIGYREAGDPRFALGDVAVSGERRTPESEVRYAAALTKGSNVWLLDVASAEHRVEALPWVDAARVRRTWPNRVSIELTERVAVARVWVASGGSAEEPVPQIALIDGSLRVLALEAPDGQAAALPLFRIDPQPKLQAGNDASGSDVERAYDAMVQLRALGLRISEVDLKPATGVTVACDDGLHVILGSDDDLAKKVSLFKAIEPKITAPERVVYVDLRSVRAPTVLYR